MGSYLNPDIREGSVSQTQHKSDSFHYDSDQKITNTDRHALSTSDFSSYTLPTPAKVSPFVVGLPFQGVSPPPVPHSEPPKNLGWDFVKDSPKKSRFRLSNYKATGKSADSSASNSKKSKGTPLLQPVSSKDGLRNNSDSQQDSHSTSRPNEAHPKNEQAYSIRRKPAPPRPMPPSPLGITRKVDLDHDSGSRSPSPISISRPPARESILSTSSDPSSSCLVQVGASPHVQQDAHETIINYIKPTRSQAPQLQPAPRTREEARNRIMVGSKRGLPPPPVPISPSRPGKGMYVVIGAEGAQNDAEERNGFLFPLPPTHVQPGAFVESVGSKISLAPSHLSVHPSIGRVESTATTVSQSKVHPRFAALDDRTTERSRRLQNKRDGNRTRSWFSRILNKLCNVQDDDAHQPHARPAANKKLATKQKNISKLDISYPRPMHIPQGNSTANISVLSGGVGGPAAAVSISRKEEEEQAETATHPSRPASAAANHPSQQLLQPQQAYRHHQRSVSTPLQRTVKTPLSSPSNDQLPLNKSKSTQNFWPDFVSPANVLSNASWATTMGRKRGDSDTSFGCQGIDDEEHQDVFVKPSHSSDVGGKPCPVDTAESRHSGSSVSPLDDLLLPSPLFSRQAGCGRGS